MLVSHRRAGPAAHGHRRPAHRVGGLRGLAERARGNAIGMLNRTLEGRGGSVGDWRNLRQPVAHNAEPLVCMASDEGMLQEILCRRPRRLVLYDAAV
jgi:hypothetical protein